MRSSEITLKCHPKISHIHLLSSSKSKHNTSEPTLIKRIGLQNLMNDARCKAFNSSHETNMALDKIPTIPSEYYKIRLVNIVHKKNVLESLNFFIPTR